MGSHERLLFDCLRASNAQAVFESLRAGSAADWSALLDLAEELMVAPMLRDRLLSASLAPAVPASVRPQLVADQRQALLGNLRTQTDFHRVAAALRAQAVPLIALKGMHLASLVYPSLAVRSMGDIDLLVPAADLRRAADVLAGLGFRAVSPFTVSPPHMPYAWHELPRFVAPGASVVELHWHIVDPHASSSMPAIDVDELWQRAVPARLAGVDAQVLSPEDFVLHQCIHATYAHLFQFALRPWCDLAATLVAAASTLDWPTLVERATRWRCRRGTYLALRLAHDLVGAAVPGDVLDGLRPDDLDERILLLASRQRHRVKMPVAVAQLGQRRNPLASAGNWRRRILLPRDVLADAYNVPRASPAVYAFYMVRLVDLLRHHWRTVLGLYRGDRRLTSLAGDTVRLTEFLAHD